MKLKMKYKFKKDNLIFILFISIMSISFFQTILIPSLINKILFQPINIKPLKNGFDYLCKTETAFNSEKESLINLICKDLLRNDKIKSK